MQTDAGRLSQLIDKIDLLVSKPCEIEDKERIDPFGMIACVRGVHIKRVSFYEPCLILVMSGRKVVYDRVREIQCPAGNILAVPAPSILDLTNEPESNSSIYKALVIPFAPQQLEKIRDQHNIPQIATHGNSGAIKYDYDPLILTAIEHYLNVEGSDQEALLSHRVMEILLILASKNPDLLGFLFSGQRWSQRVRSILGEDLSRPWEFVEVCGRLAVSETTLRRHLQSEKTGFREILSELRLTSALMRVMQTSEPITNIALDSGYQSASRFTQNFHARFGMPPTKLREAMIVS